MSVYHNQRISSGTLDYIGLSTDSKPTPDQVGSLFYESDTGKTYIYTGSAWAEYKGPTLVGGTVTIGSALPAGTNNIGDVDVLTLPALVAGESHIGTVGGNTAIVQVAFTRPADQTAYAAKDAVSNSTSAPVALSFTAARVSSGSGYITKVRLITDQSTNVAQFRLHLFNVTPTPINDNSPYTLLWATRGSRVGFIDVGPLQTEGTGSDSANGMNIDVRLAFACAVGDTNLYCLVETLTAFTPSLGLEQSGQNFLIEFGIEQN